MNRSIHVYLSKIGRAGGSKMTPKKLKAIRKNLKLAMEKRKRK